MNDPGFYRTAGPMSVVPEHPALAGLPDDPDGLRRVVQGLLLHRDLVARYGVEGDAVRLDEQHLRTTAEVLARAFELSPAPAVEARPPVDRVLGVCRHFALLYTALLRRAGTPARVRCGFAGYFEAGRWYDHWVTERWDGGRWVRDDPQVDAFQAEAIGADFDLHDQPPGRFLTGGEAWQAARAGRVDPSVFGIFDMWGMAFIAGNLVHDLACLDKVELLPWDGWGTAAPGPFEEVPEGEAAALDDLALLAEGDDTDAIRHRMATDEAVRVPSEVTSFVDGVAVPVHLDLAVPS